LYPFIRQNFNLSDPLEMMVQSLQRLRTIPLMEAWKTTTLDGFFIRFGFASVMVLVTMLSRVRAGVRLLITVPRGSYYGHCPICEKWTIFLKEGTWLRDQLKCYRCNSIPRWRALIHILQARFPNWRERRIHESSPGGPASEKLLGSAGTIREVRTSATLA
jgi:hypothetical protein